VTEKSLEPWRGPASLTQRPSSLPAVIESVGNMLPASARADLERWAHQLAKAFAPNTRKGIFTDWRHFAHWVVADERHAYLTLVGPGDLVRYLDDQVDLAKGTINRRMINIAKLFDILGHPQNPARHDSVLAHLAELRREGRHAEGRGQDKPLRMKAIKKILDALDPERSERDERVRLILGLAYDGMLRRSEVTALQVRDLLVEDGQALGQGDAVIDIQRSKTDQTGESVKLFCSQQTAGWAAAWINRLGLGPMDYLVCRFDGNGSALPSSTSRMSDQAVAEELKRAARQAGIEEAIVEGISGHSPRIGATQDMVVAGRGFPAIVQAGRWKNAEMVSVYARGLDAKDGAMGVTAREQGRAANSAPAERVVRGFIRPRSGEGAVERRQRRKLSVVKKTKRVVIRRHEKRLRR